MHNMCVSTYKVDAPCQIPWGIGSARVPLLHSHYCYGLELLSMIALINQVRHFIGLPQEFLTTR